MNLRPPGYEPDELPSCSTPRHSIAFIGDIDYYTLFQQFCQEGAESFFAAEAEDENAAADLLSRKPAATPIHAPPRGATSAEETYEEINKFQFTPLREGRFPAMYAVPNLDEFQFTPLREGRRKPEKRLTAWRYFNSRPSARGDDTQYGQVLKVSFISIHAPPRGATNLRPVNSCMVYGISIHAPPRGATFARRAAQSAAVHFNSRPSARGDQQGGEVVNALLIDFNSRPSARGDLQIRGILARFVISIHAPPRGATAKDMQFLQIFCSTLTNQHGLTIVPRNLSRLFW